MFKAVLIALSLSGEPITEMPNITFPDLANCETYAKAVAMQRSGPHGNWWVCVEAR